jgi:hypothetical protein
MINWSKKGLLIEKGKEGFTHASHPCAIEIDKRHISNCILI